MSPVARTTPHSTTSEGRGHHRLVGVDMRSDPGYAAVIFGIRFSHRSNSPHYRLTPDDHRKSAWKRNFQPASIGHAVSLSIECSVGRDCLELIAAAGGSQPCENRELNSAISTTAVDLGMLIPDWRRGGDGTVRSAPIQRPTG